LNTKYPLSAAFLLLVSTANTKEECDESEIRAAQMAVSHYRAALLLESAIDRGRA
jgi:hypothetical protein